MRWEALFADLEGQLAAAGATELASEVADRTRRELARTRLVDRGRHAVGARVAVGLGAAGAVRGTLARVGADWWLVVDAGSDQLVPVHAVMWVTGLAVSSAGEATDVVDARLTLGHPLRALARDRCAVTAVLRDGATVTGTIDRVGADFVDVAEHAPNEPRRTGAVTGVRTVAFDAIAVVRAA